MTEEPTQEGTLSAELRELGMNLVAVLRTAWDQPERKRLQQEIVNGLNEMGTTIRDETDKFTQSPTGQRLKSDVSNVTQRVQSGELEARGRQELLNALQMANQQIQRAIEKLSERSTPGLNVSREGGEGMSSEPYTGPGDTDKRTDRSSADPANEERTEIHPMT
jgi:hypothetical protein